MLGGVGLGPDSAILRRLLSTTHTRYCLVKIDQFQTGPLRPIQNRPLRKSVRPLGSNGPTPRHPQTQNSNIPEPTLRAARSARMSGPGHSRRFDRPPVTSGLHPRAELQAPLACLKSAKPRHQRCKHQGKSRSKAALQQLLGGRLNSVEHTILFLSLDVEVSKGGLPGRRCESSREFRRSNRHRLIG
jgi:hypothetical protein